MAVWEIRTHSDSLFYRIFENYTSDFPHFSKIRHFAPAWGKSRDTFVHCDMRCLCTGFARALPGLCPGFAWLFSGFALLCREKPISSRIKRAKSTVFSIHSPNVHTMVTLLCYTAQRNPVSGGRNFTRDGSPRFRRTPAFRKVPPRTGNRNRDRERESESGRDSSRRKGKSPYDKNRASGEELRDAVRGG